MIIILSTTYVAIYSNVKTKIVFYEVKINQIV